MTALTAKQHEFKQFAKKYLAKLLTGLVITDGSGRIIFMDQTCESLYGIHDTKYQGKHISYLEEQGTFNPSVGMKVLSTQKKETLVQPDQFGDKLLVTGVPLFDEHQKLEYVITYSSWNVSNYQELRNQYEAIKEKNALISKELAELRSKDMRFELVANSEKMMKVMRVVKKMASAEIGVIITGEAGAGKSMIAKEIHRRSNRAQGPFIQVSCSAFKNNVLQDELFGYFDKNGEKPEKVGLCEMANEGSLLIEDIELLNSDNQKKLLHLIKNRYYFKPGSEKIIDLDVRILATTGKDLTQLVKEGKFDKELFYRLNIACIHCPSLRERREDIIPFIKLFLEKSNMKYGRNLEFSEQANSLLACYDWPGNVCELKYLIQKLVLTVDDHIIQGHHLPSQISPYSSAHFESTIDLKEYLEFYEKRITMEAYEQFRTTVGVAKYLGISQATAVRKLQKYIENYDV